MAKVLLNPKDRAIYKPTPAQDLRAGNLVLVEINDLIPSDGEIVEGVASVNESAITGESAPVIREAGGAMAFEIKLTNFARGATGATRSLETTGAAAL